jgi:transposase-like protein
VYPHHLQSWRAEFERGESEATTATRQELRELKEQQKRLERELTRKDKALAEAAALLVLQKKFQALWKDKDA